MHRSIPLWSSRLAASAYALALTLTIGGAAAAQETGIAVGAAAPGAKVVTLDGKATDLATYIGKRPVVLEFWATWCPLCKQLEPAMEAARAKYGDRVTFVAVGVNANQTAEKQRTYAMDKHIGGELVFDRDGKAVAAYKAPHTSYIVAIDQTGKVAYTGVGPEQDVDGLVQKALGGGMMHQGAMAHGAMGKGAMDKGSMSGKDGMKHDSMKSDGMKSDGMKSDGMKPDAMKPDGMKSDGMKPDAMKPDAMKHDGMKHDGMKHDGMKHDGMKSDGMGRDSTKSGGSASPSDVTASGSR